MYEEPVHVRVLSCFSRIWLFVTLWTVACQAPLSMQFSRKEYWSGLPCPPPGDLPKPEIEPYVLSLMSPALAGGFFTTSTTWKVPFYWSLMQNGNNWLRNKLLAEVTVQIYLLFQTFSWRLTYKMIILMALNVIAILLLKTWQCIPK